MNDKINSLKLESVYKIEADSPESAKTIMKKIKNNCNSSWTRSVFYEVTKLTRRGNIVKIYTKTDETTFPLFRIYLLMDLGLGPERPVVTSCLTETE